MGPVEMGPKGPPSKISLSFLFLCYLATFEHGPLIFFVIVPPLYIPIYLRDLGASVVDKRFLIMFYSCLVFSGGMNTFYVFFYLSIFELWKNDILYLIAPLGLHDLLTKIILNCNYVFKFLIVISCIEKFKKFYGCQTFNIIYHNY